jgi:cytochrome bd-type quinol oxidase subunit 2
MRKKKYIYDLIVQVLLILAVMQLFRQIPNKIHASYWASVLFVLLPISMMIREWIFCRLRNKLWWGAVLQFWLFFAIPLFLLRILYPKISLSEVEIMGIPVKYLHSTSNYSYLVLICATVFCLIKESRKEKNKDH